MNKIKSRPANNFGQYYADRRTIVQSYLAIDGATSYCINSYYQVLFIIIAIVMSIIAYAYTRIIPVHVWKIIHRTNNYI